MKKGKLLLALAIVLLICISLYAAHSFAEPRASAAGTNRPNADRGSFGKCRGYYSLYTDQHSGRTPLRAARTQAGCTTTIRIFR